MIINKEYSQTKRVLNMLTLAKDRGITSGEFAEAGILRYSSSIKRLRLKGHMIITINIKNKSHKRYKIID